MPGLLSQAWEQADSIPDTDTIGGLDMDGNVGNLGSVRLQHVRDEHLLRQAISIKSQPFRKARSGTKLEDLLLESRSNGENDVRPLSPVQSEESFGNHRLFENPDPPFNIPREWGRKARHDTGWLRRLGETRNAGTRSLSVGSRSRAGPRVTSNSTEKVAQMEDITSPESIQSQSHGIKSQKRSWEDELEMGSIMQSTPAILGRSRVDLSTIQSTHEKSKALRDNVQRWTGRQSPISQDEAQSRMMRLTERPLIRKTRHSPEDKRWRKVRNIAGGDKENVPLSGIAPNSAKDAWYGKDEDRGQLNEVDDPQTSDNVVRNQSDHQERPIIHDYSPQNKVTTRTTRYERSRHRQSSSHAPEVVVNVIATPAHVNTVTEGLNPTKTPQVMGAWIDTPMPIRHASPIPAVPELSSSDSPNQLDLHPNQAASNAANLPKSALENVVDAAKKHRSTMVLGDDTIASLEQLLHDDDDQATATQELDATLNLNCIRSDLDQLHEKGRPVSKADEERRDELLAIQGMNKKLTAARRGVREVGKGLRAVERRVEEGGSNHIRDDISPTTASRDVDNHGGRVWRHMRDEVVELFILPKDKANSRSTLGRLSWLGVMFLSFVIWWAIETSLCSLTCHPRQAASISGFGVVPNAPRIPFVIPTLLFRPVSWLLHPFITALSLFLSQLWKIFLAPLLDFVNEGDLYGTSPSAVSPPISFKKMNVMSRPDIQDNIESVGRMYEIRERTTSDRESSKEIMDDDPISMDEDQDTLAKKSSFGIGNLWSWRASPAEAIERHSDQPKQRNQPITGQTGHRNNHMEQSESSKGYQKHEWEMNDELMEVDAV